LWAGEAKKATAAKQQQCYISQCFCPGRNMTDRLLKKCINIKFRAKLSKRMNETLQMLTEAYGIYAKKCQVSLGSIKSSKSVTKI
jgi:adenylate cyclase